MRVELAEGVREIEETRKRKTRESMVSSSAPGAGRPCPLAVHYFKVLSLP